MNIKNRLQRLENITTLKEQKVYCVELTTEGKYKFNSGGKEEELTEAEFKKFEGSRSNGVFIIDDISRLVD